MSEIKKQLQEQLSNLQYAYSEVHDAIEWAELTETYEKASAVYREIEKLEGIVSAIKSDKDVQKLHAFVWHIEHLERDASDEEILKAWELQDNEVYNVSKYTPDEFAELVNDERFNDQEYYVRFIMTAELMDKELTTHQRGVILRGICNAAALRDKNPTISENNTIITCNVPLSIWDLCSISCDAEAFGLKAEFHQEGHAKIVFSSLKLPKESITD